MLKPMLPEVMEGRTYSILPCVYLNALVLSTEAFVFFKFVNVLSRNFGI